MESEITVENPAVSTLKFWNKFILVFSDVTYSYDTNFGNVFCTGLPCLNIRRLLLLLLRHSSARVIENVMWCFPKGNILYHILQRKTAFFDRDTQKSLSSLRGHKD